MIPNATANIVILTVFYFFTYELRLVQLKLEARNFSQFLKKQEEAQIVFLVVLAILLSILVLIIGRNQYPDSDINIVGSTAWIIHVMATVLHLGTDIFLVLLLWFYFIYFFRKKKQFLSKTRGQFSRYEKVAITWTFIVLLSNTINIGFDNSLDIMFLFIENFAFEGLWNLFQNFWFSLLILNNGVSMLILYRHVAQMQISLQLKEVQTLSLDEINRFDTKRTQTHMYSMY